MRVQHTLLVAATVAIFAACDDDPTGPEFTETATLTVDATDEESWALVRLGTEATLVTETDPAASSEWDIGFQMTSVLLNGGESGPGSVVGHCICQNAGATADEVVELTDADALVDFEAVTAADAPADPSTWSATAFDSADPTRKWYRYNLEGAHQIWPTYNVYLVRSGDDLYKVQLVGYYSDTGDARHITFRYAALAS